jgi:hypothetical protein
MNGSDTIGLPLGPEVAGSAGVYSKNVRCPVPHLNSIQFMMLTRTNRSSGLIRNSYLLDKQMIIDNSC